MGDKITSSLHEVKIVATVPRRMTAINRVIFLRDGMFWKQLEKIIDGSAHETLIHIMGGSRGGDRGSGTP